MPLFRSPFAGALPTAVASAAIAISAYGLATSASAGVTKQCYKVAGTPEFLVRGEQLRRAALFQSNAAWNAAQAITAKTFTGDAKQCSGGSLPAFAPNAYYGQVAGPAASLRMARVDCTGGAPPLDQFYSIGHAIYHRNCHAGEGIGYISFWGRDDGNASTCFPNNYPKMFELAGQKPSGPVTAERMRPFNGSDASLPAMVTQPDFALGNAITAVQIAEVARDYLVLPSNAALLKGLDDKSGPVTPSEVIGGLCPAGVSEQQCQNQSSTKGRHPLAWGGAQAVMMGPGSGWGTKNGATSEFGRDFEAGLLVAWAGKALTAAPDACPDARDFNPGDQYGKAMMGLFKPLFPFP